MSESGTLNTLDTLGKRLKWARLTAHKRKEQEKKLTLKYVSDFAGVALSTIDKLEKDQSQGSYKINWDELARHLRVDRGWLLHGDTVTKSHDLQKLKKANENNTFIEVIGVINALTDQYINWQRTGKPSHLLKGSIIEACKRVIEIGKNE
ncbi:MAG: helix-turn-helix transcriptional regulator [Flavobacteriales bacterium]